MSTNTQEYVAPQGITPDMENRQSDPFWYRNNASYLYGVTNTPSNPRFGIEEISLKPSTSNQIPHGILANGTLRTVVGSISFQIRLSKHQAPFVQTISTPIDKEKGQYWEHINLRPQVKAQILRHYEALANGQMPQQPVQQQPMYGMQQGFGMQPQFGQQQMYGMQPQPQMGMQPQFGMQQQPQFNMQSQQFPQFGQQTAYQPPTPQDMSGQGQSSEQSESSDDNQETGLVEDELPI
ncbi:hypothetical protein [Bacillus subtilis]|uniref:hypothetical protein n=1 Tax=Bacillus subtilis TaxID=1423 RepID=UPI0021DADC65|nr:hypothetical protein [Bacillus subtilis]